MKKSFPWQIRKQTQSSHEGWEAFAKANGIEAAFWSPDGTSSASDGSVTCFGLWKAKQLLAVAPVFEASRECGLWVRAGFRGQGVGRVILDHLLGETPGLLQAVTRADNPFAAPMEHLLQTSGFESLGAAKDARVWRRRA